MRIARILPGIAVLHGRVFVCGGEVDSQILANGEVYDPHEDAWSDMAAMTIPRCEFGMCAPIVCWCANEREEDKFYSALHFSFDDAMKKRKNDPAISKNVKDKVKRIHLRRKLELKFDILLANAQLHLQ